MRLDGLQLVEAPLQLVHGVASEPHVLLVARHDWLLERRRGRSFRSAHHMAEHNGYLYFMDVVFANIPHSLGTGRIRQAEEIVAHLPQTGQNLGERRHDQVLTAVAVGARAFRRS